jgi:hypothetical protein
MSALTPVAGPVLLCDLCSAGSVGAVDEDTLDISPIHLAGYFIGCTLVGSDQCWSDVGVPVLSLNQDEVEMAVLRAVAARRRVEFMLNYIMSDLRYRKLLDLWLYERT